MRILFVIQLVPLLLALQFLRSCTDAFTPASRTTTTLVKDVLLRFQKTTEDAPSASKRLEMVGTFPTTKQTSTSKHKNKPSISITVNIDNDDETESADYSTDVDKWMQTSESASKIHSSSLHSIDREYNHATVMAPFPDKGLKTLKSKPSTLKSKPSTLKSKPSTLTLRLDDQGRLTIGTSNENEPDIVLLEGLSTKQWSGMAVSSPSCSTTSSSTSFSSLLLQTQVPFEPVKSLCLGNLVTCHKLLAAARLTRYWMGPKFGTSAKDIPVETQFLLLQLTEDDEIGTSNTPKYAIMMPLVHNGCRSTLEHSESRCHDMALDLMMYAENGGKPITAGQTMNALYVAVSNDDPFHLIQRAFEEVADTLQTFRTLSQKSIPSTVNDFGWCTWDAFYSRVHPQGIVKGLQALKEAGVPARSLILDDGWQHVSPQPKEWTTSQNTHQIMDPNTTPQDDIAMVVHKANVTLTQERNKRSSSSTPIMILFAKVVCTAVCDLAAKEVTHFYERMVQKSNYDSLPSRIWTFLAWNTCLKQGLEQYFQTETDFCRQLDSFDPNWKFQEENSNADRTDGELGESMSLGSLVKQLKTELGVKKVYCWHALHGYWRGVTNELGNSIGINVTQIFTKPSEKLLRMEPQMAYDTPTLWGAGLIDSTNDLKAFFRHLHEPLVEAGVDGVKVDVQSGVSAAGSGVQGNTDIAKEYTQAMEASVAERFPAYDKGSRTNAVEVINCMCHNIENLYRYKTTAVARASDDFYPDRPESHTVHLINVAYNSLFLGEIALPDWDMFHSKHKSADLHGAARAIGGCPIYVSDFPGEHNVELLKKLVMPDGSILRAQNPGRPTRDCLFANVGEDEVSALKIWNTNPRWLQRMGSFNGGVVGAFNVQGVAWNFNTHTNEVIKANSKSVTATVKPHDVDSLRSFRGPFAVWSHRERKLTVLENGTCTLDTLLFPHEWEVFTIEPMQESDNVRWAPIGLGEMMNSGGAVLHVGSLEESVTTSNSTFGEDAGDGRWRLTTTAQISTRGPGRFVAFAQPAPSRILVDDGTSIQAVRLSFTHDPSSGLLQFNLPEESTGSSPHQVAIVWDL